eukprot:SAG31_NODE_4116_length_3567_cov_2.159746_1_plen_73_part_00
MATYFQTASHKRGELMMAAMMEAEGGAELTRTQSALERLQSGQMTRALDVDPDAEEFEVQRCFGVQFGRSFV